MCALVSMAGATARVERREGRAGLAVHQHRSAARGGGLLVIYPGRHFPTSGEYTRPWRYIPTLPPPGFTADSRCMRPGPGFSARAIPDEPCLRPLVGVQVPVVAIEVHDAGVTATVGRIVGLGNHLGPSGHGHKPVNLRILINDEVARAQAIVVVALASHGAQHDSAVVAPAHLGMHNSRVIVRVAHDQGGSESERFEEGDTARSSTPMVPCVVRIASQA